MSVLKKCEVCLFFSKPFDSFNRVFNISIPQEVFHIVWNNSYSNSRVCNKQPFLALEHLKDKSAVSLVSV